MRWRPLPGPAIGCLRVRIGAETVGARCRMLQIRGMWRVWEAPREKGGQEKEEARMGIIGSVGGEAF